MGKKKRAFKWVTAEVGSLNGISRFVREWLCLQEGYRDSERERYLVELAVVEACTNVIRYAYRESGPGRFCVGLARAGDTVEVLVLDQGAPFDPTKSDMPDPRRSGEGGYGIFLMHTIMGSVAYDRRGSRWNCLRLVRKIPEASPGPETPGGLDSLRRRIVSGKETVG